MEAKARRRPGRKAKWGQKAAVYGIRLGPTLEAALDGFVAEMARELSGVRVTRADAIRSILADRLGVSDG